MNREELRKDYFVKCEKPVVGCSDYNKCQACYYYTRDLEDRVITLAELSKILADKLDKCKYQNGTGG